MSALAPPIVHEVLRSPGRPLEPDVRSSMESRFGHDFGRVRVHTDARAAASAQAVSALAYAVGSDLVFASGRYAPATPAGRRLLTHELAHVVQQGPRADPARELPIGREDDPSERSAEEAADRAAAGSRPKPLARSSTALRRYTFGTSPGLGMVVVPREHRARVQEAMRILSRVARNRRCREFFRDNCTAGLGANELATAIAEAEIYFSIDEGDTFGLSDTRRQASDPRRIAYNITAFNIGAWQLASTLLHEMFHTCVFGRIPGGEALAESALERCHLFSPWILEVSPRSGRPGTEVLIRGFGFGPAQQAQDHVTFNGVDAGRARSWILDPVNSYVRIRVRVPAGATSGPVVVVNNGIHSNGEMFTVR